MIQLYWASVNLRVPCSQQPKGITGAEQPFTRPRSDSSYPKGGNIAVWPAHPCVTIPWPQALRACLDDTKPAPDPSHVAIVRINMAACRQSPPLKARVGWSSRCHAALSLADCLLFRFPQAKQWPLLFPPTSNPLPPATGLSSIAPILRCLGHAGKCFPTFISWPLRLQHTAVMSSVPSSDGTPSFADFRDRPQDLAPESGLCPWEHCQDW